MRAAIGVRLDVRGFQGWKRSLAGDRATALVGIGDENAKRPLAEPRPDQGRTSEAREIELGCGKKICSRVRAPFNGFPERPSVRLIRGVRLEGNDVAGPARGHWNPFELIEEKRLREDTAADGEIAAVAGINPPIACDPAPHFRQRRCTIRLPEGLPRE